ncbi:hypothetical protein AB2063_001117 [Clostridium botulinum]
MNIKNLEIEKEYKYKELVKLLEEDVKGCGKSRTLQLKDWKRYFNFYKPNPKGQKFIVTEIYNKPKEKIDGRGKSEGSRNNSVYGKYIDKLLLDYIKDCKDNVIYTTNNNIANVIGVVGINYKIINDNRYRFKQYLYNKEGKVSITAINNVLNDIYNTIKSVIPSSLRRLEKKGYIAIEQDHILSKHWENRLPTKEEKEIIKNAEKQIMEEMKISTTQKNYNYRIRKEYYKEVEKLVLQEIEDIDNYFVGYRIIIKNRDIEDINVKEYKEKLKELLIEKVKNNMIKNKNKIEEEHGDFWGSINPNWQTWIKDTLNCNYISYTDCIIYYVLQKKQDIKQEILNTRLKSEMDKENIKLAKEWLEN